MAVGLEKTLEVLARTRNDAAVGVLVPALDSPHEEVRNGALLAILERRSPVGGREVLRRLTEANECWKAVLREKPGRLTGALRDAVLGTDRAMFENAARAIVWLKEYDLVPTLVTALEDPSNPHRERAVETLVQLVAKLYEELASPRDYRNRRDPQRVRRSATGTLEKSLSRFGRHKRREVVEAFLMLASRDNLLLRQILTDPHHGAYLTLVDVLQSSESPGVMRLLLSFLDDPRAPSAALHVLARRTGLTFVRHLTGRIGYEPAAAAAANLKRIESIAWASGAGREVLHQLDDRGQHAAVQMVVRSGMKRLAVFGMIEHLLVHGKTGGRRAAAAALAEFQGAQANDRALAALDDDDPQVQAHVLRQLRSRGIPGSFTRLIKMVDSRHEVVRAAARESLNEFTFDRYLPAFDTLEEPVRSSTGALVKKVDPQCAARLVEELGSRARTRRIRAIEMAEAMDLVDEVESELIGLLRDEDHVVRLTAVHALAESSSEAARNALAEAMYDRSAAVRDAVEEILARHRPPGAASAGPQPAEQGAST